MFQIAKSRNILLDKGLRRIKAESKVVSKVRNCIAEEESYLCLLQISCHDYSMVNLH